MNSHDIYNLSEAYLDVYENQQQLDEVLDTPEKANQYARKNVRSILGAFAKGIVNKDISQLKTINKRTEGAKRAKRKAERKAAEEQKESFDIYDIILSHLLDEGYAETPEAAEVIMVNMSEDWRESIVEVSLKTKINAYAATQDPDDDSNERLSQGEKIMKSIVKKHGKKAGEHADAHAQSSHWGRTDSRTGKRQERPVPRSSSPAGKSYESQKRTTQSGKMNKTDQKTLKSKLQRRASERKSGETSSTHHPSFYHR